MSEPKPFASLGPSLLARKGGARPAMRPQFGALAHAYQPEIEDLGWNDMGAEPEAEAPAMPQHTAPVLALTPAEPACEQAAEPMQPIAAPEPEIHRQQRKVADAVEDAPSRFASLGSITPRRSAFAQGRRAAFTLRLDEERHLRLRLATAASGRSAQQLVTEALDRFLSDIPELDGLAAQLKRA